MTRKEHLLDELGGCSCHLNPPCSFCVVLTEEEADAFASGGMEALKKYLDDNEDRNT